MVMKKNGYWILLAITIVVSTLNAFSQSSNKINNVTAEVEIILNPYENVDWGNYEQHKAALHVHTLQSDGYNNVDSVIRSFRKAGFTILALSDHDKMEPNSQFQRGRIDWSYFDEIATPYPKDPKPINYPLNTTWPWSSFGGPNPKELGMVGIESAEISFKHHMNSFFSDYGSGYTAKDENELLEEMQKKGGLVIFNHPSSPAPFSGGGRKSLEWYIEHFNKFPSDFLIGIDITGDWPGTLALWDQLLARFMPTRPIWGFCTSDMHRLPENPAKWPHSIFVSNELSDSSVRKQMVTGQFYSTKATRGDSIEYPTIDAIEYDLEAGTISIKSSNCDTIKWISAPESLNPIGDLNQSELPWPSGRMVHEGFTINYKRTPHIKKFLRAELSRTVNGKVYRTYTNPFGIGEKN